MIDHSVAILLTDPRQFAALLLSGIDHADQPVEKRRIACLNQ